MPAASSQVVAAAATAAARQVEGDEAQEAEGEEDVEGGLEGPSRERGHPVAPAGLGEHHLAVVVRPDAVELRLKGVRRLLQIGEHSFLRFTGSLHYC